MGDRARALRRRLGLGAETRRTGRSTTIVSIDPDWKDDFGHFGAWDQRVGRHSSHLGHRFVSLCHRDLQHPPEFAAPTFSERQSPTLSKESLASFEVELRDGLRTTVGNETAVACMYAGSLSSLAAVHKVAIEMPKIEFVVNLMRSHPLLDRPESQRGTERDVAVRHLLQIAPRTGVRIAVDSERLRVAVQANFDVDPEVWPMMATTPRRVLRSRARSFPPVDIVAPTQPQTAKGYDLLAGLAHRLESVIERGDVRLTARSNPHLAAPLDEFARRIRSSGGRLVEGDIGLDQYGELIASADLIVVPYRASVFSTRTSAVVIDALSAGVPVVTTANTWGSSVLEEFGVGCTFRDGDVESLFEAVTEAVGNLEEHTERARDVSGTVAERYSPAPLIQFLTEGRCPPTKVADDIDVVSDVLVWASQL